MSLLHRFLATGAPVPPANYIEECFSTWLYTGNGSTQTITNGIDLAGKGGLTWIKARSGPSTQSNWLFDTARGAGVGLRSNTTQAEYNGQGTDWTQSFLSTGFSFNSSNGAVNNSSYTYVSWTFREQPKFFDVVTWTGNGTAGRQIPHNLGSTPGCIMVKRTSGSEAGGIAGYWIVYHQGLSTPQSGAVFLNTTDGRNGTSVWNNTAPTSTVFTVGDSYVNYSGDTYVAYLFAHNAGGFGLTGTDNVISCGSYTADGTDKTISLGYEPQWVMVKRATNIGDWIMLDNMRNWSYGTESYLKANTSGAEDNGNTDGNPVATGFFIEGAGNLGTQYAGANQTMIYIAIRRGPMKVPTLGTSVLAAVTRSGNSTQTIVTGASSPPDLVMVKSRNNATEFAFTDRLRGVTQELSSAYTFSEADFGANPTVSINMNGWTAPAGYGTFNQSGYTYVDYLLSRYPNVFDEVCWTGNSTNPRSLSHNLTVAPTLIITKKRNSTSNWITGYDFTSTSYKYFYVNDVGAATSDTYVSSPVYGGQPTASVFIVGNQGNMNQSGDTYVSYLFASCPGVSKVGSYTGNGSSQTINCGFTTGARFVLIKRTDSTGNWVVADSARGLVAAADPALYLNSTAAEVTGVDWIDPDNSGFIIIQEATFNLNVNGASYIYLAIA